MTKKLPKEKRIEGIVQAAVDEFLENGYDGASMEAIAERAGISKGGLYHHFSSKDEIFLLANQKLNEPVAAMMLEASQKPTSSEGIRWHIKNYLNYWLNHEREMVFYLLSYVKLLDNPSLRDMYENYTKSMIAFYQGFYQRGIDSGEFVPHHAYESVIALMAAVDGIMMYLIMDKDLEADKIFSIFEERFIRRFQKMGNTPSVKKEKL